MKRVNEVAINSFQNAPEKILQFGEGNFLRAFVDWMVQNANEQGDYYGSIVLCQPIAGGAQIKQYFAEQQGVYTVLMRGLEDGTAVEKSHLVTSVSRCINAYDDWQALQAVFCSAELEVVVSNTTEAGIAYHAGNAFADTPPSAFPAKITKLLYQRYLAVGGDPKKGLLFLPVELIDQNGTALKQLVLQYAKEWNLSTDFQAWVEQANHFTNTLVDRIVTGYPKDEIEALQQTLGYQDHLLVTAELFHLWVIEGDAKWAELLPVHKSDKDVLWVEDVTPYKMQKVRILNGAHTGTVLAAFLAGHDTVLALMQDTCFRKFLNGLLYEEVIPTLPLPEEKLKAFADAVFDRFSNPYIKHLLLSISLNSVAKWKARCLPSLLGYVKQAGIVPKKLAFSLAALIRFYRIEQDKNGYVGIRADGSRYAVQDEAEVLAFFSSVWQGAPDTIAKTVLGNQALWGQDLNQVDGLCELVHQYLQQMQDTPMEQVVRGLV